MSRKVIILVNTGSPDSSSVSAVRRYLGEFLNDRRVIDIPWLARKLLVNLIIVPFRAPVSAEKYRQIWTEDGSPLKFNHQRLTEKLQQRAGDTYKVIAAMRYGKPSLKEALRQAHELQPESIKIVPLYPHYASSTTGSVYEHVMRLMQKWDSLPDISFTGQFYTHHLYIETLAGKIREHKFDEYDHVLFSYHGLPLKHIEKAHPEKKIHDCRCENDLPAHGSLCYKATTYHTTRLLADRLNLKPGTYSTSYQSRFASNWLSPFTDSVLKDLVIQGKRKVLVVSPSFAADCLETLHEIGEEYRQVFSALGGERLDMVESLNYDDKWVEALAQITGV